MIPNTDALVNVLLDREQLMVCILLDQANARIADLEQTVREKNDCIAQLIAARREDAITIARLRTRCENDEALQRALATRDARTKAQVMSMREVARDAADCQRTAEYQR